MGTVYHCHHTQVSGLEAAVKTMDPVTARSPRNRRRFVREAEVLFTLDHPHIVKVRNVHMDHDPPFLEMDFVAGTPLGQLLSARTLTRGAATTIAMQLCSALDHLHARGVFHRDIKPDNIIVAGEHATLVDFGLVTEDQHATLSRPGALFGTLQYVPPEWGGAARPDGTAWDRYSLGVVIYEAFTATPAFRPPAEGTFVQQLTVVQDRKRTLPHLDPGLDLPEVVRELVRKLTARAPEDRGVDLARAAADLARLRSQMSAQEAALVPPPLPDTTTVSVSPRTWHSHADAARVARTAVPEDLATAPSPHDTVPAPPPDRPPGPTLVPLTHIEAEPEAPPPPSRLPWLAAAVLGVSGMALAMALWPAPAEPPPPPAPSAWPLTLVVTPDPPALPVDVHLDGEPVTLDALPEVASGSHQLQIWMGTDCTPPGSTEHCAELVEDFVVDDRGTGARRRIRLPEVVSRTVTVSSSTNTALRVHAGSTFTDPHTEVALDPLLPGVHPLVVQAGTCPDTPCTDGCPDTCAETALSVVVPFDDAGPITLVVDLEAPAPPKKAAVPRLFSVGRMVRWLERHPDYQPGGSATRGLSSRYLRGWTGSTPPERLASGATIGENTPVEAVSAKVAQRVCAGRGGLLPVDAAPGRWSVADGGPTPWFELRASGSGTVLLQNDGTVLPVTSSDARPMVGFRCVR